MIIEPVKTELTSWQICLGLAPLPEKILKETTPQPSTPARKIPKRNHKGSRVTMTKEEVNNVKKKIAHLVENKATGVSIYKHLIKEDFLPKNKHGLIPSIHKIHDIIKELRRELHIPSRYMGDSERAAYELQKNGFSDEEIADKLNIKVVSVRIIRARYRKRIGIDTLKPKTSAEVGG